MVMITMVTIKTQVISGPEHSQTFNFRRGYHVLDDDFQRTNETGNAIINTSRYGSDENTQESTRNGQRFGQAQTGSQTIHQMVVTY